MIFESGISTAQQVSDISGRGVGMDAVRALLQSKGGNIRIEFTGPINKGFRPFKIIVEYLV